MGTQNAPDSDLSASGRRVAYISRSTETTFFFLHNSKVKTYNTKITFSKKKFKNKSAGKIQRMRIDAPKLTAHFVFCFKTIRMNLRALSDINPYFDPIEFKKYT